MMTWNLSLVPVNGRCVYDRSKYHQPGSTAKDDAGYSYAIRRRLNMKRIISRVILLVIVVLMWGCPSDTQTRYVGLEGKIEIAGVSRLSNVWVGVMEIVTTNWEYNQLIDSTLTDSDGSFILARAVPELWNNTTGCSASPNYLSQGNFALLIAPEILDTAYVLFYADSAYYFPDQLPFTPAKVFIGEHYLGGVPGNVRQAPLIILEY